MDDPELERIYINLIKACLAFGMSSKLVAARFGVSHRFVVRKCGKRRTQ